MQRENCGYIRIYISREVNNEEGNDVLNHNTQSNSKITDSFRKESSQNGRSRSIGEQSSNQKSTSPLKIHKSM